MREERKLKNFIYVEKLFYFNHSGINVLLKTNGHCRNNVKTFYIENIMTYNKILNYFYVYVFWLFHINSKTIKSTLFGLF